MLLSRRGRIRLKKKKERTRNNFLTPLFSHLLLLLLLLLSKHSTHTTPLRDGMRRDGTLFSATGWEKKKRRETHGKDRRPKKKKTTVVCVVTLTKRSRAAAALKTHTQTCTLGRTITRRRKTSRINIVVCLGIEKCTKTKWAHPSTTHLQKNKSRRISPFPKVVLIIVRVLFILQGSSSSLLNTAAYTQADIANCMADLGIVWR